MIENPDWKLAEAARIDDEKAMREPFIRFVFKPIAYLTAFAAFICLSLAGWHVHWALGIFMTWIGAIVALIIVSNGS